MLYLLRPKLLNTHNYVNNEYKLIVKRFKYLNSFDHLGRLPQIVERNEIKLFSCFYSIFKQIKYDLKIKLNLL